MKFYLYIDVLTKPPPISPLFCKVEHNICIGRFNPPPPPFILNLLPPVYDMRKDVSILPE